VEGVLPSGEISRTIWHHCRRIGGGHLMRMLQMQPREYCAILLTVLQAIAVFGVSPSRKFANSQVPTSKQMRPDPDSHLLAGTEIPMPAGPGHFRNCSKTMTRGGSMRQRTANQVAKTA
jgi:hypothetical protein